MVSAVELSADLNERVGAHKRGFGGSSAYVYIRNIEIARDICHGEPSGEEHRIKSASVNLRASAYVIIANNSSIGR